MLTPKEVQVLLTKLCVKHGFCLPPDGHQKIVDEPPDNVVAFVDAVFAAESLDPETANRAIYRRVRDVVAEAFWRSRVRAEQSE
jgi:hypothetical protein